MADETNLLDRIRKVIQEENEPIKKRLDGLEEGQRKLQGDVSDVKQGQEQTNATLSQHATILEAMKAGQDDIRDTMATGAEVMDVGAKVDRITKNHERRIKELEKLAGIDNKN